MYPFHEVTQINEHLYVIRELNLVNMYLILGEKYAMLLDTGYGYIDFRPLIRELTGLPLIVVNTHSDIDHAGGNHLFEEVWLSQWDYAGLAATDDTEKMKKPQLAYRAGKNPGMLEAMDQEVYFATSVYQAGYRFCDSGHIFDLGGRRLEVMNIPGHTPGSIALFDCSTGILFTGDSIVYKHNVYYMMSYCQPLKVFQHTLGELWKRRASITALYPAHGIWGVSPELILETWENIEDIPLRYQKDEKLVTANGWVGYKHYYKDTLIVYSEVRLQELLEHGL